MRGSVACRTGLLAGLLLHAAAAPASTLDARHLKLEIRLDAARGAVVGRATETLRSTGVTSSVELEADEMDVTSVRDATGRALPFEVSPPLLRITLPRPLPAGQETTVAIDYTATPRRGLHFLGPSRERPHLARQVWTQSWPREARYWFPCPPDPTDKVTSEIDLDAPASYEAVANGILAGSRSAAGRRVWRWTMDEPIPTYLIGFVAGEYEVVRSQAATPPVSLAYLVYRGRGADARKTFGKTPEILRFFSSLLDFPYPFPTYSQAVVADFPYEGMENPTATMLSDAALLDDRTRLDTSSDAVIAHEAAHQWWGDIVTPRGGRDLWLSEGLSTYFDRLWQEHDAGAEAASYRRLLDRDAVLAADGGGRGARAVVFEDPQDPAAALGVGVYQRSALVLDLLRRSLGEDAFWSGLRSYLRRFAFETADTADFRRALESASGRDLGPFFDHWLLTAGVPTIRVSDRWSDGQVTLTFRQSGSTDVQLPYRLPIDVRIVTTGRAWTDHVEIDQTQADVSLPCDAPPLAVVADPDARLPVRLEQARGPASLRVSLARGATAAERAEAARALGRTDPSAGPDLAASFNHEEFWGVRAEIAAALGRIGSPAAFDALDGAVRDRDPRVRAVALAAATRMPEPRAEALLLRAVEREESDFALSSALRALGFVRSPRAFEVLAGALGRDSHADRIRVAALAGLAALQDLRAVPLALGQLSRGNASAVRVAAVSTLRALGRGQRVVSARLTALLEDDDSQVRGAAAEALGVLGDPRARGRLREALGMEPVPAVRREMSRAVERIESAQ
jgi:aminopeptidase N